jgi:hypothetical protein
VLLTNCRSDHIPDNPESIQTKPLIPLDSPEEQEKVPEGTLNIKFNAKGILSVYGIPEGGLILSSNGLSECVLLIEDSSIEYWIDGKKVNNPKHVLYASDYAAPVHSMTFIGTKDGIWQSYSFIFIVEDL